MDRDSVRHYPVVLRVGLFHWRKNRCVFGIALKKRGLRMHLFALRAVTDDSTSLFAATSRPVSTCFLLLSCCYVDKDPYERSFPVRPPKPLNATYPDLHIATPRL